MVERTGELQIWVKGVWGWEGTGVGTSTEQKDEDGDRYKSRKNGYIESWGPGHERAGEETTRKRSVQGI